MSRTEEPVQPPSTQAGEEPVERARRQPAEQSDSRKADMRLADAREQPGRPIEGAAGGPGAVAFTRLYTIVRFLLALFLFVGALQLMKTGAASLDVLQNEGLLVRNPGSTFGLGWIGALFVLSGSPVAATALTLVEAGSISEIQGFTMLTGSRLGAAFVVLVVAVVYAIRGGSGERKQPVSTAVIALSTTALVYIPSALIGFALLRWAPFHALNLRFPNQFSDLIDVVYGPLLARVEGLPSLLVFFGGLAVLLVSFRLIDTVLPKMDEGVVEKSKANWMRRKWPMFGLGSLVALVTMSVSVALTVLVPLVAKRIAKREDILPYIMGANITTLGDTMLAALALNSPAAVRIVLAEVIATSTLSIILLAFFYQPTRRLVWRFQRQVVTNKPRLALFTAGLFAVPIAVIALSSLVA
jgi:solute carrier family 34 (sodium-dependent phosphate cotransporter)